MTAPRSGATIYLGSYGLSLLGGGVASVLMPLLVLERTGDVLAAGLLATVSTATSAGVGILGGLVADRFDRRAVSAVSDVVARAGARRPDRDPARGSGTDRRTPRRRRGDGPPPARPPPT